MCDPEQLAADLGRDFADWASGLTVTERSELRAYQGFGFDRVNRILRGLDHPSNLPQHIVVSADIAIENLDSAISKGRTIRDLVVYRGVTDGEATFGVDVLPGIEPGDLYTDLGYMSTSLDPKVAIAKAGTGPKRMLVKLTIPAGHPAAWLPALVHSPHRSEMEILLPRGTSARFVDLQECGNLPMMCLDVVKR